MYKLASKYLGIGLNERQKLVDYYNTNCYPQIDAKRKYKMSVNDDWCAMFTTVIAHKSGFSALQFPYEVSVWYQAEIAKKRGQWFTDARQAKPDDLIIYDWGRGNHYNHVGFVVSNSGGVIRAIEGNKSKTVAYRNISTASKLIKGFIRTSVLSQNSAVSGSNSAVNGSLVSGGDYPLRIALLAVDTLKGRFGDGLERKEKLGKDYNAVQELINK